MEASGSMELAENALARATQVFVKVRSKEFQFDVFVWIHLIKFIEEAEYVSV